MPLPDAQPQEPSCGACASETYFDGDVFVCEDCQLVFDKDDFSASFLDESVEPCGTPCGNWWHGDNRIKPGIGYDCGTCHLPTGHAGMCWTGCQAREAAI